MTIPTVVLGASGYVGGEILRLLDSHPDFELAAALSATYAQESIASVFPHLARAYPASSFVALDDWSGIIEDNSSVAFFSAAPHGAAAARIDAALREATAKNLDMHVVDASADFRFANLADFEGIYGITHPAPHLADQFVCAVPEHRQEIDTPHVAHPGCFATATLLAAMPLVDGALVNDDLFVSGVTGSTGSGRSAGAGTHHPERHSNLYAYKPLAHRHAPEVESLLDATCSRKPRLHFVPHSGPFARGIHITLQAKLASGITADQVRDAFASQYAESNFVHLVEGTPRLKNVVASNHALLSLAFDADSVSVMCVIDNLVKGAAGGAWQWMNRLWSLPEERGLLAAPPAWT